MVDWCKVGREVVCVDGKRYRGYGHGREVLPVEGAIYRIRAIDPVPGVDDSPWSVRIFLNEIINEPYHYLEGFSECSFRSCRFRPVINAERDLAEFEAILRGVELEVVEA